MRTTKKWGKMLMLGMTAMVLALGLAVVGCDNGSTGRTPPEQMPEAERWWYAWSNQSAGVTVDYSVDDDGVCTITVGGTAADTRWYADCQYGYTVKKNTAYAYTFEAWTESGDRDIGLQYYNDNAADIHLGRGFSITSARKTYTIYGESLPKSGEKSVQFQCGDQLGTFYVKMLSINVLPADTLVLYNHRDGWWAGIFDLASSYSQKVAAGERYKVTVSGNLDKKFEKFSIALRDTNTEITDDSEPEERGPGSFTYEAILTIRPGVSATKSYLGIWNLDTPELSSEEVVAIITGLKVTVVKVP
jgi:hypothetical protein